MPLSSFEKLLWHNVGKAIITIPIAHLLSELILVVILLLNLSLNLNLFLPAFDEFHHIPAEDHLFFRLG